MVRRLSRILVALAIVAIAFGALKDYRQGLEGRLEHVRFGWLTVAATLSLVYRVVNAFGWVLVLRALGQAMRVSTGIRLWLVSETLRWLPGSVWSFFSRVAQARSAGVPALTASLSLPLELLLTIAAWSLTAVIGMGVSGTARIWLVKLPALWIVGFALALAATMAAVLALARWRPTAAPSRKLRALWQSLEPLRTARPRPAFLVAALALFLGLCFLNGFAFRTALLAVSDRPPGWLSCSGINAAGWLLGFFAFFAPAGLGVREGTTAAMLAPLMPVDAAIIAVLFWRLIQIAVEVACLAACFAPAAFAAARRLVSRSWAES